jgi:thiol-disulfide isomerase/thioredoxin
MYHLVGSMRGRLEPGSQAVGDIIRWRLPGAVASVPFDETEAKLVLQKRQADSTSVKDWPDTMYFFNRDRIPCRVLGIQDQTVHFESFTQRSAVEASRLKAIDLESSFFHTEIGPRDNAWIIPEKSKDLIQITDERIQISDGASLSHPHLMTTGGFECEFHWSNGTYGFVELNLFGDPRMGQAGGTSLILCFYDSQVMIRSNNGTVSRNVINCREKVHVRVRIHDQALKVALNNKEILTEQILDTARRSSGVTLSVKQVADTKFKCEIAEVRHLVAEGRENIVVASDQKELMLTIPRIRRNNPPQQILRAINGDMLRGEILAMDQSGIRFRANQEVLNVPRSLVSSLIWLHFQNPDLITGQANSIDDLRTETKTSQADSDLDTHSPGDAREAQQTATAGTNETDFPNPDAQVDPNSGNDRRQTVQVLVVGDRRLTYNLTGWRDDELVGVSEVLGECAIPLDQINELRMGSFANQALDVPYSDWVAKLAPEPFMNSDPVNGNGITFGSPSPLIGTSLSDLTIPMLEGEPVTLKAMAGKVIVLDFWATWCSPCIRAMPELIAATNEFSPDDVILIAVNQEEDSATIQKFLENRDWKVQVGLDSGSLSRRLQVQSLPQTIVIGPDGKIAFVKTGYSNDLRETLQKAITSLLEE